MLVLGSLHGPSSVTDHKGRTAGSSLLHPRLDLAASLETMASRVESLPEELKLRIAEYIPRPSDLKALCLTSQAIRIPATALLYRKVTLTSDIAGWRYEVDKVESGLLSSTNPGLHQIRELRLESAFNSPDDDEDEAVEKVIKALPRNVLRHL